MRVFVGGLLVVEMGAVFCDGKQVSYLPIHEKET